MQAFTVEPTLKPVFWEFRSTRFTKKLLPVLYFPTIETMPIFRSLLREPRNDSDSWVRLNPSEGE